jgi:hypothetical protein
MEIKRSVYTYLLVLLIILENLFFFVFPIKHITDQNTNAFGFFFTSLAIALVLFFKFYKLKAEPAAIAEKIPITKKIGLPLFFIAILIIINVINTDNIKFYALNPQWSDIIPNIQLMARSFIHHKNPYGYETYSQLGYHDPAGYLPAHWMPFIISEYFSFDPRTISFTIWCCGAGFIMIRTMKQKNLFLQILIPFLFLFAYYLMLNFRSDIPGMTVEIIIFGYYMLLIAGINQKNILLTSFFLTLCLLSRYYIAPWALFAAVILFISGHKKDMGKMFLFTIILLCLFYVIPYLSHDWSSFSTAYSEYESTSSEWNHLNDQHLPMHLYSGLGFAYLFYQKYLHTNLDRAHQLLNMVLYISLFASMSLMCIWYWFNKNKIYYKIFLLVSFKIYLSLFYAFVHTPYAYIICTGNFVSLAIFAEQARYKLYKISTP